MECIFRKLIILPAVVLGFVLDGCTDEEKMITYDGPDKLRFSYVGETQVLTFEAADIWTASVSNTGTTTDKDWVVIDGNSGGAGANSLKITVNPNDAQVERTAALTVFCGGEVLAVPILQSAFGQDGNGERPEPGTGTLVSRISITDPDKYKEVYDIEYKGESVSKITVSFFNDGVAEGKPSEMSFIWEKDKVTVTDRAWNGESMELGNISINLDAQGRAVKYTQLYEDYSSVVDLSYNADGSLAKSYNHSHGSATEYLWSGANLTSAKRSNIEAAAYKYSEHANNANLDLNWLFSAGYEDGEIILPGLLNLLGKRSANYVFPKYSYDYVSPSIVEPIPSDGEYTYDDTSTLTAEEEMQVDYKVIDGRLLNAVSSYPVYRVVTTYKVYRKIRNYDHYLPGPNGQKLYPDYEETVISKTIKSKDKTGTQVFVFEIEY